MKYLFVHQHFPGQFLHIVRHLLSQKRHDVVAICEPNENHMPGVRVVNYKPQSRPEAPTHPDARDFAHAMMRAQAVAAAGFELKRLGFTPDIIIGHHGWGELLNMQDVWPGVPLLGYHELYYLMDADELEFDPEFRLGPGMHANIRAKNAVNLLALTNPGHGQSPTNYQRDTYPDWARPNITLLPEGVDLARCRPARVARAASIAGIPVAAGDKLVTYVARNLEPYRGFHQVMRALPALLERRPDARVVMVGGDGVSYGATIAGTTWREHMLKELGSRLDLSRVHFPGRVEYADYLRLLQRSDAHVYFSYPFVASWSLREALACGCALVCSDVVSIREFVRDGETGLLTPFFDPAALVDRLCEVLEGGRRVTAMRRAARDWAEQHLAMADYLARYEALIARLTGTAQPAPRPGSPGRKRSTK